MQSSKQLQGLAKGTSLRYENCNIHSNVNMKFMFPMHAILES